MRNNSLVMAIVAGIVGVLLIIFEDRGDLLSWIVVILGIMFMLPGLYTLVSQLLSKGQRSTSDMITAIGCVGLGLCMCIVPGVFVSVTIYILALSLIIGGVMQMVSVAEFKLPLGFYIVPALVAITGVVMFILGAEKDASIIVLVAGIAMVIYAVNLLVEYYQVKKITRSSGV